MTIRILNPNGDPLDPHTAETYLGEFSAWRVGSFHVARVSSNYPPSGSAGDEWLVQGARGAYGTVQRLNWDVFLPVNPQGRQLTSQGSLIDALGALLPA